MLLFWSLLSKIYTLNRLVTLNNIIFDFEQYNEMILFHYHYSILYMYCGYPFGIASNKLFKCMPYPYLLFEGRGGTVSLT